MFYSVVRCLEWKRILTLPLPTWGYLISYPTFWRLSFLILKMVYNSDYFMKIRQNKVYQHSMCCLLYRTYAMLAVITNSINNVYKRKRSICCIIRTQLVVVIIIATTSTSIMIIILFNKMQDWVTGVSWLFKTIIAIFSYISENRTSRKIISKDPIILCINYAILDTGGYVKPVASNLRFF